MAKYFSVLLASASSGGTIAAVRDLGMRGFDVGVVSSYRLSAAAWSRHAARTYRAPLERQHEAFLERVLEIGAADPGRILLPTSDETAWMYSQHASLLQRHFHLYQPPVDSLRRVLDKRLLSNAAISAGLNVLPTWIPKGVDDVVALASTLSYPILIKPRTHVHRLRNDKGVVVSSASELIIQYQKIVDRERFSAALEPASTDDNLPILQKFVRADEEGVLSVTGFIDQSGEQFVTRVATKVFKRSQPVGVGVCFEARPPDLALSDAVRQLCRQLGYFGIFEVEFLRFDGHWAIIDFNPRIFNQLALDIRRGMPLPLLACLDALGDRARLRDAVAEAQADTGLQSVFCDRFTFQAILLAQTLTGRVSRKERAYWREWMKLHAAENETLGKGDLVPGIVHGLSEIYLGIRSLPRFMRLTPRVPLSMQNRGKTGRE